MCFVLVPPNPKKKKKKTYYDTTAKQIKIISNASKSLSFWKICLFWRLLSFYWIPILGILTIHLRLFFFLYTYFFMSMRSLSDAKPYSGTKFNQFGTNLFVFLTVFLLLKTFSVIARLFLTFTKKKNFGS